MEQLRDEQSDEEGMLPSDLSDVLGPYAHERYTSTRFLFSEELTERTPLQQELDELADYENSNEGINKFRGLGTVGGTGAAMFVLVRILQAAERAFITDEKKEMQEEMDLTGMYVAIDAGEVEGAVDPKTGKNITVGGIEKLPKTVEPGESVANVATGTEAEKEEAPWLLRVLGLGNAAAMDDESFFDKKVAPPSNPAAPSGGKVDAGGVEGEQDPSAGDDDSEVFDELEDLLG